MIFTTNYLNRILNAKNTLGTAIKRLGGDVTNSAFSEYPNIISGLDLGGKVSVKLCSANNGSVISENESSFTPNKGFAFNYAKVEVPFDLKKDAEFVENGTYAAKKIFKKEGILSFKVNVDTDADDVYYIEKTIFENGTYKASDEVDEDTELEDEKTKKTLVPGFNNVFVMLPMIESAVLTANGTYAASDWPVANPEDPDFQGFKEGEVNLLYIDKKVELNSGEEMDLYIDLEEEVDGVKPSGYKSINVTIKPGEVKTEYTANFYNGTILLASQTVPAGSYVVYTGSSPTKEGYMFVGWDPTPGKIEQDTDYFAVFEPLSAGKTQESENAVSWALLSDSEYVEDSNDPIKVGVTTKHLNIGCIKLPETIGTNAVLCMQGNGVTAYCIGKNQDESKYVWAFQLSLQYIDSPAGQASAPYSADSTFFVPPPGRGIPYTTDDSAFSRIEYGDGVIGAKYNVYTDRNFAEQGVNDTDINITYESGYLSTFLDKLADAIEENNPGIKINTVEKRYAKLASDGTYEQENNYINARCWLFSFKELGHYSASPYNAYEESRNYTLPSFFPSGASASQHTLRADVQKFIYVKKWIAEQEANGTTTAAHYEDVTEGGVRKQVSRGHCYYMDPASGYVSLSSIDSKTAFAIRTLTIGFCIGEGGA